MSLEVNEKYIKVPRVTTTERNALTAANAMLVYDTTLNKFYFYENGAWINVGGGGGSWGSITGTLSSQTDLQNALNAKEASENKTDTMSGNTASSTKYLSAKGVYDWAVATFTTTSAVASQITTALSGYATQAWVASQGYITNVVSALGFTPENAANKSTTTTLGTSDTLYPTQNAVKTYIDTETAKRGYSLNGGIYVSLGAATTSFTLVDGLSSASTENLRQNIMPNAGTFSNASIYSEGQPATGSFVVTLRKNGADTAIVITIAAGSGAGKYYDNTNTVTFVQGDLISWRLANNASSAATTRGISIRAIQTS